MRNEEEGIFVGPGDGRDLTNPIGGAMVVTVRDEYTAGAYSIHDNTIPPGSPGPRPHLHRHYEEAFYVLEGELTVRVGTLVSGA
jgi:mannose-6-phosphate isomerase-like protein (cupin superfamily)